MTASPEPPTPPSPPDPPDPAAEWFPLDPDEHERQRAWLLGALAPGPSRVIDLGAGGGRLAGPLAGAGHDVLAIDTDPAALGACAAAGARPRRADLLDPGADLAHPAGPADAALCLGNTLMLLTDTAAVLAFVRRLRDALAPGAFLAIDDFPVWVWREVAEGMWQEGTSEDGSMQCVWGRADGVLAFRAGDDVDESSWEVREGDRPLRLWSMGGLRLLGAASGFSGPEEAPDASLVLMRRD